MNEVIRGMYLLFSLTGNLLSSELEISTKLTKGPYKSKNPIWSFVKEIKKYKFGLYAYYDQPSLCVPEVSRSINYNRPKIKSTNI